MTFPETTRIPGRPYTSTMSPRQRLVATMNAEHPEVSLLQRKIHTLRAPEGQVFVATGMRTITRETGHVTSDQCWRELLAALEEGVRDEPTANKPATNKWATHSPVPREPGPENVSYMIRVTLYSTRAALLPRRRLYLRITTEGVRCWVAEQTEGTFFCFGAARELMDVIRSGDLRPPAAAKSICVVVGAASICDVPSVRG